MITAWRLMFRSCAARSSSCSIPAVRSRFTPLNGLNHASLAGEEARDVLAAVGHVGNSFRRDRLYRLTSFLHTVRSPPGSISKVSLDDGFHPLRRREFRKSLNTIGRPPIPWRGTAPLHAIADRACTGGRTTPVSPRTRCRVGVGPQPPALPGIEGKAQ